MGFEEGARLTRLLYNQMRKSKTTYWTTVAGLRIRVDSEVFAPEMASGKNFAEIVPALVGPRSLLEIGTGTGIIALLCALQDACPVVATDINQAACLNAKFNALHHRLPVDIRCGNLFEPIRPTEKFDVVFWNHPFNWSEKPVLDPLDRAGFDHHYKGVITYLRDAKHYLNPNGVVLLGTGSFARLDIIEASAVQNGYDFEIIWKKTAPLGATGKEIEFLVYQFTPVRRPKGERNEDTDRSRT